MLILFRNFVRYVNLRFPIIPLTFFSILTVLEIATYSDTFFTFSNITLLVILYLQFLFHMRILDEFKDFEYDSINFVNRPLQNGLVTKRFLINTGIINILITVNLVIYNFSNLALIIFILAGLYSALMFKEFFIKEFWEKSPLLYLISHQIVLVMLYFSYYIFFNKYLNINIYFIIHIFYVYIPVVLLELGRKVKHRKNAKGIVTNDTYAYVWGQKFTTILILVLSILAIFCYSFVVNSFDLTEIILLGGVVLVSGFIILKYNVWIQHSRTITYLLSIYLLLIPILNL